MGIDHGQLITDGVKMTNIVHASGRVLACGDGKVKRVLEQAVRLRVDLSGAYLKGADLEGAMLSGAYLQGATLVNANLRGAVLIGTHLHGAVLHGAILQGAALGWHSHVLMSELLLRWAKDSVSRSAAAGLVLRRPDWCWRRLVDACCELLGESEVKDALRYLDQWAGRPRTSLDEQREE